MKLKKIILILLAIFFLFSIYLVGSNIGSTEGFLQKFKNYVPEKTKIFLKETIFAYQYQKILKKEIADKDKQLIQKEKQLGNIPNEIGFIPIELDDKKEKFKINNEDYQLTKFRTSLLVISKSHQGIGNSYLDFFDNKLFVATANGIFSYVEIEKFDTGINKLNVISSNIKDMINYELFYQSSKYGIKDLLIYKNKFYISYLNEIKKGCFNTSILVADLNLKKLNFKNFFTPQVCINTENDVDISYQNLYGVFNPHLAGGRMFPYLENQILFSIGGMRYFAHAQNTNNVIGKIISINVNTKKHKIISMGHRNVQGLFYDRESNVIFSTEHGPEGGDEVNVNTQHENKVQNYGWPVSSYGEHPIEGDMSSSALYEIAPLHKSHKDHGFIEPIKYYVPSIGITEIIKLNSQFTGKDTNEILHGSMGWDIEEGDKSLHHIVLNENYLIKEHNILKINERIRDMIYIKQYNKVFLFLENSASIGIFEKIK